MYRGDLREIRRGTKFITAADGSRVTDAAFVDDLAGRIVIRMFISWDFGPPTPHDCQNESMAQHLLDEKLDDRDWKMLVLAIRPWIDDMLAIPVGGRTFTHNETGVRVTADSDEGAAKLALSGEFTQIEGAGPKPTTTAISSAGSTALSGLAQIGAPTP